jgi:tetratricopeptide (TPR) repeat protein
MVVTGCGTSPTSTPSHEPLPEPPPELLDEVPFTMPEEGDYEAWRDARSLFFAAYVSQLQGELEEAIELYQLSIKTFPTAEAHTFLGWTYSWMGRYDDAIREAKQAIALDPEYGNPYNDIGVYLKEQGKLDDAVPWLIQATKAKRYASPHYPWLNLGNIWVLKGEWGIALSSYEEFWRLAPEDPASIIPSTEAAPLLPPQGARNPGTSAEQKAVKEAIAEYFKAWNKYDADALKDYCQPPDTDATIPLLLSLAAAKHTGSATVVDDAEVLHLEGSTAIAETRISVGGNPETIWHLLRQTNGTWRIVIRLLVESPVS